MGEPAARGAFKEAFANRDYRQLLVALAISSAGDWIYSVALIAYVFEETRSPGWVGAASILRLLPYVLFGVIGGVVADRYNRRTVMVVSDLVRAGAMLGLTLVVVTSAPVALALALTFVSTTAGTPYGPALAALTPAIVGERDLAAANALMSSIEHLALVIGPAVGALLLLLGSAAAAFAINAATFLLSALFVLRVHKTIDVRSEKEEEEISLRIRVVEGLRAVTSSAEVTMLTILLAAATLVYGGELVVLILVSERLLGLGSEGLGLLTTAVGVGGLIAAGFTSKLAESSRPSVVLAASVLAASIPISLLAFVSEPIIAFALMTIEGAASIVLDVVVITALQRIVRDEVIARVFGLIDSLAVAAILIGSFVTPFLVTSIGLRPTLITLGATLVFIVVVSVPRLRAVDQETTKRLREFGPRVGLLTRVGVFDGAPRQTLERLASAMEERHVPAGTDIVTEGDAAEEFFVVLSGNLTVLSTGEAGGAPEKVNELGDGDFFGEIGLIERIPRTATVRATTDVHLYAIPGAVFSDLLNQAPAVSRTLLDGVVSRLARTHPSQTPTIASAEGSL
jgi:MFS family permease